MIGAHLDRHGIDVALVARGAHGAAIERDGLVLESPDAPPSVHRVRVAEDPAQLDLDEHDVVLLTVKSQDTEAALAAIEAAAGRGVTVVCVQNGVENERVALRRFARTYSVCVMLPSTHLEPGVVRAHSAPLAGSLDIGRHPAGSDATAERIAATLRRCGFASQPRGDVLRWKYAKLLRNLDNATRALLGPLPAGRELGRRARAEALAAYAAAGIDHVGDEEFEAHHSSVVRVATDMPMLGSSWQSLARGHVRTEADHLNGEIVLLGRLHGVPTPANAMLAAAAAQAAREGIAAGSLDEGSLLARLAA